MLASLIVISVSDEMLFSVLCSVLLCTTSTTMLTTYTLMLMPLNSYHRMGISPSSQPLLSKVLTQSSDLIPATDGPSFNSETSDMYNAHLPQSFVPIAAQSVTEQEAVQLSVDQTQSSPATSSSPATMMWPSIGGMPINEFTTKGYFSCAWSRWFS